MVFLITFSGYCENCLTKLKKKFDKLLDKFYGLAEEYDLYNNVMGFKSVSSDRKIRLLQDKIGNMENEANTLNLFDVLDKHNQFLQGDKSRELYDLKLKIAVMRQDIDFENSDFGFKVKGLRANIERY